MKAVDASMQPRRNNSRPNRTPSPRRQGQRSGADSRSSSGNQQLQNVRPIRPQPSYEHRPHLQPPTQQERRRRHLGTRDRNVVDHQQPYHGTGHPTPHLPVPAMHMSQPQLPPRSATPSSAVAIYRPQSPHSSAAHSSSVVSHIGPQYQLGAPVINFYSLHNGILRYLYSAQSTVGGAHLQDPQSAPHTAPGALLRGAVLQGVEYQQNYGRRMATYTHSPASPAREAQPSPHAAPTALLQGGVQKAIGYPPNHSLPTPTHYAARSSGAEAAASQTAIAAPLEGVQQTMARMANIALQMPTHYAASSSGAEAAASQTAIAAPLEGVQQTMARMANIALQMPTHYAASSSVAEAAASQTAIAAPLEGVQQTMARMANIALQMPTNYAASSSGAEAAASQTAIAVRGAILQGVEYQQNYGRRMATYMHSPASPAREAQPSPHAAPTALLQGSVQKAIGYPPNHSLPTPTHYAARSSGAEAAASQTAIAAPLEGVQQTMARMANIALQTPTNYAARSSVVEAAASQTAIAVPLEGVQQAMARMANIALQMPTNYAASSGTEATARHAATAELLPGSTPQATGSQQPSSLQMETYYSATSPGTGQGNYSARFHSARHAETAQPLPRVAPPSPQCTYAQLPEGALVIDEDYSVWSSSDCDRE